MDIENVASQLNGLVRSSTQDVLSRMNAQDLTDPETMLKTQFALQQYSTFVGFESALMKALKDMVSGIIAKI
ncbi:type III secretion system needle filament subunit SctF [Paludibacterium yongneupense]|uniref:type III secretion system needle filament subunit SctF n=1 Tax=Paludibacterium yongneupense TaxID=400061 RepID=UPI0004099116|nr:type III secretion system needle filament subunit SctF [Paludibacterium yongneupense]